MGSYWIGVRKINETWLKTNGNQLSMIDLKIKNDWSEGDCIVADADDDYKPKAVSCDLTFAVENLDNIETKIEFHLLLTVNVKMRGMADSQL